MRSKTNIPVGPVSGGQVSRLSAARSLKMVRDLLTWPMHALDLDGRKDCVHGQVADSLLTSCEVPWPVR